MSFNVENDTWDFCLNVPLNEQGVEEYESFQSNCPNVYSDSISWNDYVALFRVFDEWSEEFGLFIWQGEDKTITVENAPRAMKILERHMKQNDDPKFLAPAEKVRKALAIAMEANMPLYLDF